MAITPGNRGALIMMHEKIRPHHLERKAILYVRQSSAHQVLHNRESGTLQYADARPSARSMSFPVLLFPAVGPLLSDYRGGSIPHDQTAQAPSDAGHSPARCL
jgi:hypothetical protein